VTVAWHRRGPAICQEARQQRMPAPRRLVVWAPLAPDDLSRYRVFDRSVPAHANWSVPIRASGLDQSVATRTNGHVACGAISIAPLPFGGFMRVGNGFFTQHSSPARRRAGSRGAVLAVAAAPTAQAPPRAPRRGVHPVYTAGQQASETGTITPPTVDPGQRPGDQQRRKRSGQPWTSTRVYGGSSGGGGGGGTGGGTGS